MRLSVEANAALLFRLCRDIAVEALRGAGIVPNSEQEIPERETKASVSSRGRNSEVIAD